MLAYDTECCEPALKIKNKYCFRDDTVADWGMFCKETMLVFLEGCSVKIGGPNREKQVRSAKVA
jgi:hypothetical protein